MKKFGKPNGNWYRFSLTLTLIALMQGCNGTSQPPASGQVQLPAEANFTFEGDTLELRAKGDGTQLAFGQLQSDGSFTVESLVDGQVVPGAPPGSYQARLVIADDDYAHKSQAAKAIPKKYFNFDTSNLVVEVPNKNIQLKITR